MNKGFSLIEVIVVSSLIAILSSVLVLNFRSAAQKERKLRRQQLILLSDIRGIQSLVMASVDSEDVCGYGLHFVNPTTYATYKGSDEGIDCPSTDHNYDSGIDGNFFEQIKLKEENVEFSVSGGSPAFNDIFFESPDPKIYIDDATFPPLISQVITFCVTGTTTCSSITIWNSGKIDAN